MTAPENPTPFVGQIMPLAGPALSPAGLDRFREYGRNAARTAAERGELPPELAGTSVDDVVALFDDWFETHRGQLAATTTDFVFLMLDRALGRFTDDQAAARAMGELSLEQLAELSSARAADLAARVAANVTARGELLAAVEGSLRMWIAIGLQAALAAV